METKTSTAANARRGRPNSAIVRILRLPLSSLISLPGPAVPHAPPSWARLLQVMRDWDDVKLSILQLSNDLHEDRSPAAAATSPFPPRVPLRPRGPKHTYNCASPLPSSLCSVDATQYPPHTSHSYKWADIQPHLSIPRRAITQCGASKDLLERFRPSHVDEEEDKPMIPSRIMATGTTTVASVGQEVAASGPRSQLLAFLRRPTSTRAWTHPGSLRQFPRPRVSPRLNTSRSRMRAMSRRTIG